MLKDSAGILVYKIGDNRIKVLLCHLGGPYWQHMDHGSWTIPKGEFCEEKAILAAIREFREETDFYINIEELAFLGSKKQLSNKLAIIFDAFHDFDVSQASSNTFVIEWPKGSGNFQEFPKVNSAKWFDIDEAKKKIIKRSTLFSY